NPWAYAAKQTSRLGHAYLGEAEHPAAPEVAAAHLADDFAGRPAAVGHNLEDFHPLRVERLADGRDRLQAVLPQRAIDALKAHCIAGQDGREHLPCPVGRWLSRGRLASRLRGLRPAW